MKTRKNIKRIMAILTGLLILFVTVKVSSSKSLAVSGKVDSIEWLKYNYDGPNTSLGSFSVTTSGAANSAIYYGGGMADYYEDYKAYSGETIEKYEGTNAVYYNVYFSGYGDPNAECTVNLTLPDVATELHDENHGSFYGNVISVSVSGNQMTVVVKGDEYGEFDCYVNCLAFTNNTASRDWLEPLKTQLHIAADAEFGGNVNHTAEYTSNFALPAEVLQFLKDHPNTTLIYTYMKDELNSVTVKIPGKDVVLQDGVEWYGIDNLVKTYGVYKK